MRLDDYLNNQNWIKEEIEAGTRGRSLFLKIEEAFNKMTKEYNAMKNETYNPITPHVEYASPNRFYKEEERLEKSPRMDILDTAKATVMGAREQDYGSPENNFSCIADLWSSYKGVDFTVSDVALMLALLKVARLKNTPQHKDSWVDLAGYAACGGEVSTKNKETTNNG